MDVESMLNRSTPIAMRKRPLRDGPPEQEQAAKIKKLFANRVVSIPTGDQPVEARWTWVGKEYRTRKGGPIHTDRKWILVSLVSDVGEEVGLNRVGLEGFSGGLSVATLNHVYGIQTPRQNTAYPEWFRQYYEKHGTIEKLADTFHRFRCDWNDTEREEGPK
jgi:hypothetical protein